MKDCMRCHKWKRFFCVWACPSVEDALKRMEVEYEKSLSITELGYREPFLVMEGLGSSQTTFN